MVIFIDKLIFCLRYMYLTLWLWSVLPSDGEHIAIASQNGNIYVHAVYDDGTTYRRVGCCSVSLSLLFLLCFVVFLLVLAWQGSWSNDSTPPIWHKSIIIMHRYLSTEMFFSQAGVKEICELWMNLYNVHGHICVHHESLNEN